MQHSVLVLHFSALSWRLLCPQERLRQQIEEIKEQEAAYDPNAALAMAMFEHCEVKWLSGIPRSYHCQCCWCHVCSSCIDRSSRVSKDNQGMNRGGNRQSVDAGVDCLIEC